MWFWIGLIIDYLWWNKASVRVANFVRLDSGYLLRLGCNYAKYLFNSLGSLFRRSIIPVDAIERIGFFIKTFPKEEIASLRRS